MYAETGLMFPSFLQQFDELQKPNASLDMQSSLINLSPMPDYNLWGEGDLFKAPEPILEEPMMNLDPISSAISMISCGGDVISSQPLTVSDIESGQLLSDVYYECRKDLLDKEGSGISLFEELNNVDKTLQAMKTDENIIPDENLTVEGSFPKSVSSSCLTSMDNVQDVLAPLRPSFLDFPMVDFGSAYKMRRAFSEGDIKTLGSGNNITTTLAQSPTGRPQIASEDRREKLSRYWSKKSKRNFGRKIKYACRKALADSQPRIRGRFAKTEDSETFSKNTSLAHGVATALEISCSRNNNIGIGQ